MSSFYNFLFNFKGYDIFNRVVANPMTFLKIEINIIFVRNQCILLKYSLRPTRLKNSTNIVLLQIKKNPSNLFTKRKKKDDIFKKKKRC